MRDGPRGLRDPGVGSLRGHAPDVPYDPAPPQRRRRPDIRPAGPDATLRSGGAHSATLGAKLRDLALVALAFLLGSGALLGYATLRVWQVGNQDGRHSADAIVVLGTAQYNGKPSPALAARLDHAIALLTGAIGILVLLGGVVPGSYFWRR